MTAINCNDISCITAHILTQIRQVFQPTSFTVGLMTALLLLYILGLEGFGWIPLESVCTPITSVVSALAYISTAMVTIYVTPTSSTMTQLFYVASLPDISVASMFDLLLQPPVQVGTPTLPLLLRF